MPLGKKYHVVIVMVQGIRQRQSMIQRRIKRINTLFLVIPVGEKGLKA